MTLHAVARLEQLDEQRGTRAKAGGQDVLLLRLADQVRAYQADCPHAGAPLEDGTVCEHRLICPWHKAAFAVEDGDVCEPPALTRLLRYPAHVAQGTVWVDDQPAPTPPAAPRQAASRFVVVGGGAAGAAAVAALKSRGFAGQLLWVDPQYDPAYDRTALSKFVIAGQMLPEETPPLLGDMPKVTHLSLAVVQVDAPARTLTLDDGQRIHYDAALLATGAIAQRPDLPGAQLPGCFVLHSRDDARRVLKAARGRQRAVIIGDSFVGLEAASALRQLGLQVHLVSRHQVPLAKVLGDDIGRALRALHEQHGVIFHAPTEPLRLEGEGVVQRVALANGEYLVADLVLFGTGVTPATRFAMGLPQAEDRSLVVDSGMRVTDGLWAAGDMVTFPFAGTPTRIEHWRVAQQQAVLAAANMLGESQVYAGVPFFWTYHHDKTFEVLGHTQRWNRQELLGDLHACNFIALQCQDEQVVAVVACGYSRSMAALSERLKRPLARAQALALINAFGEGPGA